MGMTQVKDCEELEAAPVKAPLVRMPKSNFKILSKDDDELEKRSKSAEEINLSDKEKNRGRKKFWAGHSNLMSGLDIQNNEAPHLI